MPVVRIGQSRQDVSPGAVPLAVLTDAGATVWVVDGAGNVTVSGTQTITGAVTLSGTATFTGAVNVEGPLTITDGGVVTQETGITTGVELNTSAGQITTVAAPSIAAGAEATFRVTNSKVAVTDVIIVNVVNQFTDGLVAAFVSDIGAGTFDITLTNLAAAAVSAGTAVISFVVIKGTAS